MGIRDVLLREFGYEEPIVANDMGEQVFGMSGKRFNRYDLAFDSMYVSTTLKNHLLVENFGHYTPYPFEERAISNYIYVQFPELAGDLKQNPSAILGFPVRARLLQLLTTDFYRKDYERITEQLVQEDVTYAVVKEKLIGLLEDQLPVG
ncbi:hypothetical protein [Listeria riparia]|uniref:Uncharacterized protein n=1 Tax=Listeria riparia FSL S10-1204 TaxID=1265816 RepID=W7CYH8_9LIST|nr:hypothetical protein [Listeria riparia]EUJ44629.1 hypothetical protein PRIP_09582 [Listeria riparia FSL S10-1204]